MKHVAIGLCVFAALSTACGSSGFSEKKENKTITKPAAEDKSTDKKENADGSSKLPLGGDVAIPEEGDVDGGKVVVEAPTEGEKSAIQGCLKAWGGENPEFPLDQVRKIAASVSVGSSGVTIRDNQSTDKPALTIIAAGVNVLSAPEWELLNPNGWYCIVANVNVLTKLTVTLDETGRLADSKVSVNVGSKTEGDVAAVGVNVGSNVTVQRK